MLRSVSKQAFVGPLFLLLLLAGCAQEDAASGKPELTVMPQNHSGVAFTLVVKVTETATGKTVFEKTYNLGPSEHVGPSTKLSLAPGAHRIDLTGTPQGGSETEKTVDLQVKTISKELVFVVETETSLSARVG